MTNSDSRNDRTRFKKAACFVALFVYVTLPLACAAVYESSRPFPLHVLQSQWDAMISDTELFSDYDLDSFLSKLEQSTDLKLSRHWKQSFLCACELDKAPRRSSLPSWLQTILNNRPAADDRPQYREFVDPVTSQWGYVSPDGVARYVRDQIGPCIDIGGTRLRLPNAMKTSICWIVAERTESKSFLAIYPYVAGDPTVRILCYDRGTLLWEGKVEAGAYSPPGCLHVSNRFVVLTSTVGSSARLRVTVLDSSSGAVQFRASSVEYLKSVFDLTDKEVSRLCLFDVPDIESF